MPDNMIKARPTVYKGIQMRSRLEARFAAYLDGRGITWRYEPRCFADETGQYLPDFQLTGGVWLDNDELSEIVGWRSVYVEVKPTWQATDPQRMFIIWSSDPDADLVTVVPDCDKWEFRFDWGCPS